MIGWLLGRGQSPPTNLHHFRMDQKERHEVIKEIQLGTFTHVDKTDVTWLTSWALTLNAMSDDCLLDLWEETVNGRR